MNEDLKSYLIFEDYSISEMNFQRNYDFNNKEEIDLNFSFNGSADISEKRDQAQLTITCKIFEEEFNVGEAPFFLNIQIIGNFSLNVQEEVFDIEGFQMNGLAILLPYLRSLITSFTSQSGMPPVILPAINVYNAFKLTKAEENDK
ncbi:protein-export chaperone SecB [Oceanobacillus sp. 1P07AA]|uniref:protein-export chaperone SecB n=1 Tax=Oceanobacillus sp. 1P07AA TaxID=3132293 RepID=UPI0039A500AE